MRARGVALLVLGFLVVAACASGAPQRGQALTLQQIGRFEAPTYVAFAPGAPTRPYVVEQAGRIRTISKGRAQTFLDIRGKVTSGGEQGLLSMAFDPSYSRNGFFYVNYTDVNGDTRVMRYRARAGRVLPKSAKQLLFVDQPFSNHNGGQLQFGSDRMLYVGMGDGGSGGDPMGNGQNVQARLAKILRANPRATRVNWSVVGYGVRNPWRFSFDRETGDLLIGDVGQNAVEEIDFLARSAVGGTPENFGWNVYEGSRRYSNDELRGPGRLVMPITEYSHSQGCSVSGGYVYRGSAMPAMVGRYLYGDFCSGKIWSFAIEDGKAIGERAEAISVPELASFGEDRNGELYAVSLSGPIYRIR